jgi:uncharacterized glyoxalase superfamily protein PhnB
MLANRSMPPGTVIPVLQYPDVGEAAGWLCRAFGFTERLRIGDHRTQIDVGDQAAVVVAHGPSPRSLGSTATVSLMIRTADAGRQLERAQALGAEIASPLQDQPYGERQFSVRDPGGYVWTFSETTGDVDPASWGGEWLTARGGAG